MANQIEDVHSGSSFDDFLIEEGLHEEVESAAIKRVLAWQFEREMERQRKTKRAMAKELKTSRSQLDRLLDPQNTTVSIETLSRAARVLGKRLVLEIRDQRPVRGIRAKEALRNLGASVGEKAKVAGRGLVDRGRRFDKGAIKATRVTQGAKTGHPGS
jgi:antitoxin HicB